MPAANPLKGEAAFGESHTLTVNFDTLCAIEALLGRPWGEIEHAMQAGGLGLGDLRSIVWAALREHHPDITRKNAGDLIWELGLEDAGAALVTAMDAFAATAKVKDGNPPKAE